MRSKFVSNFFLTLIFFYSFSVNAANDRVALVIGNSRYLELGTLANPINDARSVEKSLKEMGYKTNLVLDTTETSLRKILRTFASESENAAIAVVFFAGHGAQINGDNYLLPTDIDIPKRESDIQLSAIKVDDVINSIKSKTKVVFLDACRDNPALIKSLAKGRGSFRGGLAPTNNSSFIDQSSGIFIAYATDAGNVASDGPNQFNSPFTTALLKYIKQPVSIDDMFSMVTKEVRQSTNNTQKPYKYASLDGVVCLTKNCGEFQPYKSQINEQSMSKTIDNLKRDTEKIDDSWVLFQMSGNTKQLVYIQPSTIETFGTRVSTVQKWVYDSDGSFDINYYVMDCKSHYGNVYRIDKYDSNNNLVSSSAYGNPVSIDLKFDYTNKTSIAFFAIQLACNPEKNKPIVTSDQLDSNQWERFYTIKQGVDFYYLKGSIKPVNPNNSSNAPLSFFTNLVQGRSSDEKEIITKYSFPRMKGSEIKKNLNIEMGLDNYTRTPYATSLISKVRFICGKNTNYQAIENWFDIDNKLVGYSSVIDVDKDKLKPNHPESVLAQLERLACN